MAGFHCTGYSIMVLLPMVLPTGSPLLNSFTWPFRHLALY